MTTVNKQISASWDDCRETNDSAIALSSSTVTVGIMTDDSNDIGLRWQSVNIPRYAIINSATLSLYQTSDTGTLSANIRGIDEDNVVGWAPGSRPSQKTKTTATITANEASWGNWGVGNWITIDISSAIQEIVDRGGWSANNALAVVIENTAAAGSNEYMIARSYDSAGNLHGAKLDIDYTTSGTVTLSQVPSLALVGAIGHLPLVPLAVHQGVGQAATSSQYAGVALTVHPGLVTRGSDATDVYLGLVSGMVPVAMSHQYASVALGIEAAFVTLGVRGWDVAASFGTDLELGWEMDAVHTVYTTAAIVRKRFRFVSADITHETIEQYITEAEGIIDATMKYSFLDTFDVSKHQIIRTCASDLAGLACIVYDQSDYPTIEAAGVTSNFLYVQSRKSLRKLSDQRLVEYLKSL